MTVTFVNGLKRYGCLACGQHYKHLGHVRQHIRGKHLGVTYKCLYCAKTSDRRADVSLHISTCHNSLPNPYLKYQHKRRVHLPYLGMPSKPQEVPYTQQGITQRCEQQLLSSTSEGLNANNVPPI